jgi:putative lipoic acid-binding regulatory protein
MELHASHDDLLRAISEKHEFPGFFPVVVIAKSDLAFTARLHAALEYVQEGAAFDITERPSSKNNYVSYTVQLHVVDAETALDRKAFLSGLEGVIMTL